MSYLAGKPHKVDQLGGQLFFHVAG